ncbi:MAG: hypothetical protein RIQ44_24, partial [Actinomycetota bacterium]
IRAEVAAGRSDITNPYELLKELTRGKRINGEDLIAFVNGLNLEQEAKDRLLQLKPQTYIGVATELASRV